MSGAIRLQKFLAEAGVASRRAGEQLILAGRVCVNGRIVRRLGVRVDAAGDAVTLDGRPVQSRRKVYVALHKPAGCVCSRNDERGRPTIYDYLPPGWQNLYSVGRLDFASEGLIFLTNDGEFALRLTHPRYGVPKRYVATVNGRVEDKVLAQFARGIWEGGERLAAQVRRIVARSRTRSVVELELREGKKREVRRLFAAQALTVSRLQRTQIGRIRLGELKPGRWRTLTQIEIRTLLADL